MLGFPHIHYARTDSTNARALALAQMGAPGGTIVTADFQSDGRGRQGRNWTMPPRKGLLLSVLLRNPPELLALRAGVAVAETITAQTGIPTSLKWPNDVLIDGAKVSGILVQGRPQERVAVLGVGINTALDAGQLPPEINAATLGLPVNKSQLLLDSLTASLAGWIAASDSKVVESFSSLDSLFGRKIRWEDGAGTANGIAADGSLKVELTDGQQTQLSAGEVHLERLV